MKENELYLLINKLKDCIEILEKCFPEKRRVTCLNCGKIFEKRGQNQKFCCEDCKNKYKKKGKVCQLIN